MFGKRLKSTKVTISNRNVLESNTVGYHYSPSQERIDQHNKRAHNSHTDTHTSGHHSSFDRIPPDTGPDARLRSTPRPSANRDNVVLVEMRDEIGRHQAHKGAR